MYVCLFAGFKVGMTVAWYTTLFFLHCPSRGHFSFTLQLQGGSKISFFISAALCEEIIFLKFGVVLYDILTVFLLKILLKGFSLGK